MPAERWILHADMDAFYASVEQRDRPELRGRPVIVGAGSARGVVAAASYEARVFGVRSAMPGFEARRLCPDGVFLDGDMKKYAAVSAQVRAVFGEFTPDIEPLALDEAFLDVGGSVGLFGGPLALGYRLKGRVREVTGLAVSCGIAPSKLVAKLACTLSKPDGLLLVPADTVRWLMDPLPVRRLFGVGPVTEQRLIDAGYRTLGQLARADPRDLRRSFGEHGEELARRARGEDPRPVESERQAKSVGEEATFERDVSDRPTVTAALTTHAEEVARRLRVHGLAGRTVTLRIKLGRARGQRTARLGGGAEPDYPVLSRARTLRDPTDDGALIREVAVALWDEAAVGEPVRLLGVSVSNLRPREAEQLSLFAPRATRPLPGAPPPAVGEAAGARERRAALGPALDAIREKFGEGAIHRAAEAPAKVTPSGRVKE